MIGEDDFGRYHGDPREHSRAHQGWSGKSDHFTDGAPQRSVFDQDQADELLDALAQDPLHESLLRWEHELAQPDYPHWFLDQVVPDGR
jgi:hypothetical protein